MINLTWQIMEDNRALEAKVDRVIMDHRLVDTVANQQEVMVANQALVVIVTNQITADSLAMAANHNLAMGANHNLVMEVSHSQVMVTSLAMDRQVIYFLQKNGSLKLLAFHAVSVFKILFPLVTHRLNRTFG